MNVRATDSIMVAARILDGVLAGRGPDVHALEEVAVAREQLELRLRRTACERHRAPYRLAGLGTDHVRDAPDRLDPRRVEVADHVVEAEHTTALDEPFLLVHAPILGGGWSRGHEIG